MIRSVFLHVVVPGQEPGAKDLPKDFNFPTMHQIGIGLVTILDHLRIARWLFTSGNHHSLSFFQCRGIGWWSRSKHHHKVRVTSHSNRKEFQVRNDAPNPRAWNSDGEQHSHWKPREVHWQAEGAATMVDSELIHIIRPDSVLWKKIRRMASTKGKCYHDDWWWWKAVRKCSFPVCRNVASFAEAYKRRKEFMSELNNRIK